MSCTYSHAPYNALKGNSFGCLFVGLWFVALLGLFFSEGDEQLQLILELPGICTFLVTA